MKIYAAHGINDFVDLPRLQGLRDQGVLRQLLPAHVRRHVRPRARTAMEVHQPVGRAVARDAGRHRRGHADRRAPASACCRYVGDDEPSASPTATASPTSTSRALIAFHRAQGTHGHRHRRAAARRASARSRSTATRVADFRRSRTATAAGSTAASSCCRPRCSTTSTATTPSGSASRWSAGARRPARRPSCTTASGSRWTRCATAPASRSCGRRTGAVEGLVSDRGCGQGNRQCVGILIRLL